VIDLDDGLAAAVSMAAAALREGGVVVLPTDTVYGIAALPFDAAATAALFALKGRASGAPLAVLCADLEQAAALTDPDVAPSLRTVGDRWWPGPLTVVVRRAPGLALHLGEPAGTIGVRVPDHDFVRALAAAVGPIATTSANHHGEATPPTAMAAAASLLGDVALVVDGGPLDGVASTVIDATTTPWTVLRKGPLPAAEILASAPAR
jgi:tRNA threonylcarbamoyl adenosine modification protein (Sua5/YciO/YrdC/YwlC family)